jgi:anti-sigma regulatory factor (Ser/Thr protein kinase)
MRVHHDSASAALVRHQLCEDLRRAGVSQPTIDEVMLVASELLGNAIRHTPHVPDNVLEVSWKLDETGVTVGVDDNSTKPPQRRTPSPHEPAGRGLRIVDALTDGWGVIPHKAGKRVWAHVPNGSPAFAAS